MAETPADVSELSRQRQLEGWAAIPTPEARRAEMAPLNEARRLTRGAELPAGVSPEAIAGLLANGMIEEMTDT